MQIAVISPISHLDYCSYGDIHMSLAHLIVNEQVYANYYHEMSKEGQFVILDNSAFEFEQQGIGVPLEVIFRAVRLSKPSEVIATDTLFQGPETVASTQTFINNIPDDLKGTFQIMAVPQGRNKEEWFECLNSLLDIPEVDTIGLSKLSVPSCWAGTHQKSGVVAHSRLDCLYELIFNHHSILSKLRHKYIHLLGGDDWNAWELGHYCRSEIRRRNLSIRSCDSSVSVWYGAQGYRFNFKTGVMPEFILQKPDLECVQPTTISALNTYESSILHNITVLHKFTKEA